MGGAIDNNNILNVFGSIFENNVAGAEGGAIIARNDINIVHSSLFNNQAPNGSAIYVNNNNSNLSENWWGSNNPDFENLIRFNISDEFTWIIMSFKCVEQLMQYENGKIIIGFNELKNRNNLISQIGHPEELPIFKVSLSTGDILSVEKGSGLKSLYISKISSLVSKVDNQTLVLAVSHNPSKIINNKNIAADYSGKVTFKVRVIGSNGRVVGKNEIVVMKLAGKTYNVKTDKRGYASKTFSLLPGKYSITTSYKGFSVKNSIVIKNVLKVKSVTKKKAKKIKYSASLKTSRGKSISGKKITFKVKGKTYKIKTNKKGIATVSLKNLKAGKYKISITYLKLTKRAVLKVKR